MIRILVRGRLGNNLFQYAVGRALADKHGVPLILDATRQKEEIWANSRALLRLPLRAEVLRNVPLMERMFQKLGSQKRRSSRYLPVVEENDGDVFSAEIMNAPAECVLKGFFQSERYFSAISDKLREEFDLSGLSWAPMTQDAAGMLATTQSVSVHIRRTDYLGSAEWSVCTMDYYKKAMNRMRESIPSAKFFIFSDDPAWCRTQFNETDQMVMDFPEFSGDPLHDLYLMSSAKHHIIANSSYAWWGAWLAKKPRQRVICPSRWTNGPARFAIAEKLCENWETMSVSPENQTMLQPHP